MSNARKFSPALHHPSLTGQLLAAVVLGAVTFAVAGLGGWASANAGSFYAELTRPAWAPPAWLFGPVWSVLYLMMAVAAWLVWRNAGLAAGRTALGLYAAQLVVNGLWSWLFFAWRMGVWAFVDILLLIALVGATIAVFGRIRRIAAWLLLPYFAWVCFAAVLCFSVWRLNPNLLGG
jgi:tryptophan-rich sensory protein